MSHPDHHAKSRVAAISIFASAGMAAAKFAVGIAIGSLALISEALHSSVDVVATVITWLVVRVSDRPADDEHHYGHGKFESLSALGVIAMLYVLAGGIAWIFLVRRGIEVTNTRYSKRFQPFAKRNPIGNVYRVSSCRSRLLGAR